MSVKWVSWGLAFACVLTLVSTAAAASTSDPARAKLEAKEQALASSAGRGRAASNFNFQLLGHNDLGLEDTNGDVWVHGNFAYVGTWAVPCTGRGVKIVNVSDLSAPEMTGTLAAREGTSAEDMVVRSVSTPSFTGDLMGVGIQRCGDDPALDGQQFGLELWDVTNPLAPAKLGELGLTNGGGGVHELDLFQRGGNVYALVATPFSEWFDPVPGGDFRIIDVTNPSLPFEVSDWGAGANSFSPGPFWGQGEFGAMFGHSARVSADGMKAYVSYWDLGVLTFDISDPSNPVLLTRTTYKSWEDGDAHSMTPYGRFILQNDEDFSPETPSDISYGKRKHGLGNSTPGATPLWLERGHKIKARVVQAANQGCSVSDYPAGTAGSIAVARTPFPFFDPPGGEEPECLQQEQEAAAEEAGARALVHDFVAENTSPQWFDFGDVDIPVLFTDHETAQGMVAAGRAKLKARRPSWGFLRIYDAATGRQVAKFDRAPHVSELPAPAGSWSIHNTEVAGERAFSAWYSNGVIALDLRSLNRRHPGDPKMVGQFATPRPAGEVPFAGEVWGVAIRPSDNAIFLSDMGTGLWIVKATGKAAP
jgi:hypothetical protein